MDSRFRGNDGNIGWNRRKDSRVTAITSQSIPRVGHGFRLQWEEAQQAHVLLYPEGMVKLNGSAGEILTRCNGAAPVEAIVADLEQRFATTGLEADVHAFLHMAQERRWVEFA
jgi:pyrroloquinoline quinone biosynthesis protein D